MKRALFVFLILGVSAVVYAESELTVRLDAPGHSVSPMLWGIFFEDINHAADGGLYAELIRNRSFEDTVVPERCTAKHNKMKNPGGFEQPFPMEDPIPGWEVVAAKDAKVKADLDDKDLVNDANKRALRLEVLEVDKGRGGIANKGFWGIPVKKGERYRLTFQAKTKPGEGIPPMKVTLESAGGEEYASMIPAGLKSGWNTCEGALDSSATDNDARLVFSLTQKGTVWLDNVSLFPVKTWKDRPNGLRPDLAEMLADLKPAFVRFPGGCFVEGFTFETALRWKKTVGANETRPGHWNLWGYRTTDGLGYHELLQLCEDLHAAPLLVVNCGLTCQGRAGEIVPMNALGEWVQDALDAVEYANGPADSEWGSLRAKNGHPAPFNLKYVEIGNENSGNAYEERYQRFYDALKAKYPEIELIANSVVKAPMDILDEHYYSSPEFFVEQCRKYDVYDRKGPKIYVGEYAVTQHCGKGNLKAAVGEAAFMAGMERNADIVTMASYAPLFVNVHDRCWNPDAIGFDNNRCYGTPSYHVQKMFSRNRVATACDMQLKCPAKAKSQTQGAVGVGTWETQAEFKDVKVTAPDGRVLLASDFAKGANEWTPRWGEWAAVDGVYRQSSDRMNVHSTAGDKSWTDYTLELRARKLGGSEGFLILFRFKDDRNWLWWNIGGWGNRQHGIEQMSGGSKSDLGVRVNGAVEQGRWYDIRVEVAGSRVRCLLDGALVHDVVLPEAPALAASAGKSEDGALILKVVNASDDEQPLRVRIDGGDIASAGEEEILASASPDDENSIDEPAKVAPAIRPAEGLSNDFTKRFPAQSVTVLKLKTK